MEQTINVWTDGSCYPNPGKGGWAWLTMDGKQGTGFEVNSTNNRMEIMAMIKAVECLAIDHGVKSFRIHTDSQFLINGATNWVLKWVENNWKTKKKEPVKNQLLWMRVYELCNQYDIEFKWVKGHSTDKMNNLVDRLANEASGVNDSERQAIESAWNS
jgi:ribonuclease HI